MIFVRIFCQQIAKYVAQPLNNIRKLTSKNTYYLIIFAIFAEEYQSHIRRSLFFNSQCFAFELLQTNKVCFSRLYRSKIAYAL